MLTREKERQNGDTLSNTVNKHWYALDDLYIHTVNNNKTHAYMQIKGCERQKKEKEKN
jgi:hypothetical protein